MTRERMVQSAYALLVALLLAMSALLVKQVDQVRAKEPLQEVLYIPSPKVVERLSLGYKGLLADIYWTRLVQYFGSKHRAKSRQYLILEPLLDMTTTLDPKLLPAYEFGSVFLAQKPPEGAGDPAAAARIVEKGIRENPGAWRLYYQLGFIYWLELKQPAKAADAFERGSHVPGAHPWMKVMAAALAAHAGETETATYMWTNILNSTEDPQLRANANRRLLCLRVDKEVGILEERAGMYEQQSGRPANNWQELVGAGLLRRVPLDPDGRPYQLRAGKVYVEDTEPFPFITRGLPPGQEVNNMPGDHGFKVVPKL